MRETTPKQPSPPAGEYLNSFEAADLMADVLKGFMRQCPEFRDHIRDRTFMREIISDMLEELVKKRYAIRTLNGYLIPRDSVPIILEWVKTDCN